MNEIIKIKKIIYIYIFIIRIFLNLQTLDVVIDQTNALDTTEYTLTTFLENINVGDDSCFGFVTNQSVWRYDKKALGPMTLGKYYIHLLSLVI